MSVNHRMAEKHEAYVARELEGSRTRGSGSQFTGKGDGFQDRLDRYFAFRWDCKATLSASSSITRKMWDKLVEEAEGHRPAMPLRFYETGPPTLKPALDLVVITLDDLVEMQKYAEGDLPDGL